MRTDGDTLINFFPVTGASRDKGNHCQQLWKHGLRGSFPSLPLLRFVAAGTTLHRPLFPGPGRGPSTRAARSSRSHTAGPGAGCRAPGTDHSLAALPAPFTRQHLTAAAEPNQPGAEEKGEKRK